ncbi:transcriptional regulator, AsnC family [Schinkia azotoformans MEV2011]|uniref:Transcriptional regulator, AsnC family n=1 Tax=Schinkia azotoformans MEV2011 TaxID=1348973 RepID=A0A072NWS3_SCHAZ|nr:Lrp/AsnC family transcriptional regulator [Schinkia azotoformans]KEF37665.1 transcriptional regulator, AsnC family [Schinkia azotoformans MEV2011]MEC1697951.1 Lrp/AsnC family transcriptional regulator [Schinkia azotoformans]MEC1717114.1 Lrp/AsnC family transcriptional regulator [Schinkia azotoformans]MEC1725179.1 Lrp/AsnC family transcriptional regulator [Schinkia azotoformans]MEC1741928.1 Lrp/AsnC family transcriptional regulator [Schinkia azotoformans]
MDQTDIRLLELLQLDGRITISELSKKLSLSRPSISERINRLEEKGVIKGFSARVSPQALGRNVLVVIQLSELSILSYLDFEKSIQKNTDIIECHRLTGSVSYLLKAAVTDMEHLSQLIDSLLPYGNVNTSIVLSSPISFRCIVPKLGEGDGEK